MTQQGGPQGQPPQQGYDPAMAPRQVGQMDLEGWDPGKVGARSGMAWAAIVLCGWMALVRLGQGVFGLVATQAGGKSSMLAGGGVFSFLAAGFYVWALVGLYQRKPSAYRYVIRVNALLAVLGVLGGAFSFSLFGLSTALVIQIVGIVFHLVALAVTHSARHELGYEWDD